MPDYADDITLLRQTHPQLAEELAGFHTLEKVLVWMKAQALPLGSLDIVFQDEYSHDAIIPLPGQQWLVFGIT